MLTYPLSDAGTDSLYLYLYKCIKNDIQNGTLPSGTKLPSKRSFAKNLGVSNITVESAYGLLQSEGYIFSRPKRGYYVSDIALAALPQAKGSQYGLPANDALERAAVPQTKGGRGEKPETVPGRIALPDTLPAGCPRTVPQSAGCPAPASVFADFVTNHTTPESFPFSIWAKLLRETVSQKSDELMAAPPCGGIYELRSAICAHLKQFRGMEISPEQVIVGAGTDYLYSMLILLLGRDKIYAVENPGYTKIEKVYRSHGVDCRFIGMDACGIRIGDLNAQDADIAHISPSHHYPTGTVTPVSRRYELLGWAAARPLRYIIEDDYDSEFRFAAHPLPTLQSIDAMEKVIYMNTFTKSLASTIRISYMVLPPHLLSRFYAELSFYSGTVSNFEQYTLAKFIRDGYFEKHINRMRNHYRGVRDALLFEIGKSPLAACSRIAEESAGLHFILHIDTPLSDGELMSRAKKQGLRIACLSQYYHTGETAAGNANNPSGSAPSHALVMNYSGIRREDIKEAVRRLSACVLAGQQRPFDHTG